MIELCGWNISNSAHCSLGTVGRMAAGSRSTAPDHVGRLGGRRPQGVRDPGKGFCVGKASLLAAMGAPYYSLGLFGPAADPERKHP